MRIINLTPHEITFFVGREYTFKSEGIARVKVKTTLGKVIKINGEDSIQTIIRKYGDIEGLPEPKEGVIYVVSSIVAEKAKREDVFAPDYFVTNEEGRIIGCHQLAR